MKHSVTLAAMLLLVFSVHAGTPASQTYRYSLDLNNVQNDQVKVTLYTPQIKSATALFCFPKIIPGTYRISDYGKFISEVKAFDKAGKELPVKRVNDNQWKLEKAKQVSRITYVVDDVFDTELPHNQYPMSATNIEPGNIVMNMPGFFGFLDGMTTLPFEVSITRPENYYASTSMVPASSTKSKDVFRVKNVDELYDAPVMYTVPDTATVKVGNCNVLVSVYSPNGVVHAKTIAEWMSDFLYATRSYLGGKLPTDKYAFLYYFRDPKLKHSFPPGLGGALEHNTSSFYYLFEVPGAITRNGIINISAHEFFHIITPLTIASKEVKRFNWNEPVLSKHLWLYEGVTEYSSHHAQVTTGLNTVPEFLTKLSGKITSSKNNFNDTLAFTELSKHSADTYANEFGNVYQKGALIAAALDIYLLHLSKGEYGLKKLIHDLGQRYGRDKYFNDEELFSVITKMTYPEIGDFFKKYVEGTEKIPYDYFFGLAGVKYIPTSNGTAFGIGRIALNQNEKGLVYVTDTLNMSEIGRRLGYRKGDEFYSINGKDVTATNFGAVTNQVGANIKEGDPFEVKVGRKNEAGTIDTVILKTNFTLTPIIIRNKLELMSDATPEQLTVQKAWTTEKKGF